MNKNELLDEIIELGQTIDSCQDASPMYIKISKEAAKKFRLTLDNVAFTEYDYNDPKNHSSDWIWADEVRGDIHGFEQEDGKVVVYKHGKVLKVKLKNKEAFIKKYFTEAI